MTSVTFRPRVTASSAGRPAADPEGITVKSGAKVRIRVINAGSDTAYRFAIGGHRMTVVATDGFPVEPAEVDTLILGMGERFDVMITPQDGPSPGRTSKSCWRRR